MKIALCLSGLPRFIESAFYNIQNNIIQDYNVDVFIHTWYDKNKPMRKDGSSEWSSLIFDEDPTIKIRQLYNVKGIHVEKPIDFFKNSVIRDYNYKPTLEKYMPHFITEEGQNYFINMIHSMWYSIHKSNLLKIEYEKENHFEYDVVVRCRFDSIFHSPIKFENYDLNKINVSHCAGTEDFPQVRDWFAFSNSKNMDQYAYLINDLKLLNDQVSNTERANEIFLHQHLKNKKIQVNCYEFVSRFIRN